MQNAFPSNQEQFHTFVEPILGLLTALIVIGLWLISFVLLISVDVSQLPIFLVVLTVILRTFLQTGVFITAHDAMHGSVFPPNRHINNFIGSLAINLYALLPYKEFLAKHSMHHRYPASQKDPDFYDKEPQNMFIWFFKFMTGYLNSSQTWVLLVGMTVIFWTFKIGLHIPIGNLCLFWLLPMLLSSWQLFYFGVFLPHRQPKDGYQNRHRANSSHLSPFWSFITCYHFGYHWEHHEYPHIPWYKLPSVRTVK